jgi:hypothetical protein
MMALAMTRELHRQSSGAVETGDLRFRARQRALTRIPMAMAP